MRNLYPKGVIHFNGKRSDDLGIIVSKYPIMRRPARKGTVRTIPGRSGASVSDTRAYETYVQPYEISIINKAQGIAVAARAVADWLLGSSGYCRLEDDFEPDVFRLARYASQLDIETIMTMHGTAVIEFECQPQRYLKSGEKEIVLSSGEGMIFNPTAFEARPLLKITAEPQEAVVVPYNVELEWTEDQAISGKPFNNTFLPNPYLMNYADYREDKAATRWVNYLSQPIDVEGCTAAIISTAQTHVVYGIRNSYLCYTFLDADGNPVGVKEHVYGDELDRVEIPVPSDAKTLYIAAQKSFGNWTVEPSVTIIPPPTVPYSDSTVTVNGVSIHLSTNNQATVYLDCDRHDAYFPNMENANNFVSFEEIGNNYPTFPGLSPGENAIMVASETTISATIVPRWWTL